MELQVYVIIVVVFLASFFSLLFINKQLRGGKTFEEVLAEKRLLTERLYGPTKKKGVKKANVGKKVWLAIDFYLEKLWQDDDLLITVFYLVIFTE